MIIENFAKEFVVEFWQNFQIPLLNCLPLIVPCTYTYYYIYWGIQFTSSAVKFGLY